MEKLLRLFVFTFFRFLEFSKSSINFYIRAVDDFRGICYQRSALEYTDYINISSEFNLVIKTKFFCHLNTEKYQKGFALYDKFNSLLSNNPI